jgi:retron-type reverse transcriptase
MPKTFRHLYPQVWDWDNLLLAYRKARKGKRARMPAATFEFHRESNLIALQEELGQKCYQPGAYHSFYIHEPKLRLISAAPFRDRVVHHALCNVIEPIFERRFIHDSYANRKGKGTHKALDRAQQLARHYRYALPCDVRQFFPAIDHAVLRGILGRVIACRDTMALIGKILASGEGVLAEAYDMVYFPGDNLLAAARPRGLPIGNLTSQFWANVYLNELDQFVKRQLKVQGYVRYVDDMLFFADDKRTLWRWRAAVIGFLSTLRLTIHESRAQPRPVTEGLPFLGFIVFPDHRRLKQRKGVLFQRRLKRRIEAYQRGAITLEQLQASVQGWVNHVRYGDTWGLREAILSQHVIPKYRGTV